MRYIVHEKYDDFDELCVIESSNDVGNHELTEPPRS